MGSMDEHTVTQTAFEQIGVSDLETGVALFNATGLSSHHLADPITRGKLQEIAEFFRDAPDPAALINSVTRTNKSPSINNLDHLFGFVKLSKEKVVMQNEITRLDSELKFYAS